MEIMQTDTLAKYTERVRLLASAARMFRNEVCAGNLYDADNAAAAVDAVAILCDELQRLRDDMCADFETAWALSCKASKDAELSAAVRAFWKRQHESESEENGNG